MDSFIRFYLLQYSSSIYLCLWASLLLAIHEIRFGLRFHPMKTFSLFVPHSFYFSFLILSLSQSVSRFQSQSTVSLFLAPFLLNIISFGYYIVRCSFSSFHRALYLVNAVILFGFESQIFFIMDFVYVCNKILLDQMNSYSYNGKKKLTHTHNTPTLLIWARKSNMTEVPF